LRNVIAEVFAALWAIVLYTTLLIMQAMSVVFVILGIQGSITSPSVSLSWDTLFPSIVYVLLAIISGGLMLTFSIGWGYYLYIKKQFHKQIGHHFGELLNALLR